MPSFPKSRPKALDKQDQQRDEEALYQASRKKALQRDGNCCRICGKPYRLEAEHVQRRSKFGSKKVLLKHDLSNLMMVCGPSTDTTTCHGMLTKNILKAVSTTANGTNGPVLIQRYDDKTGEYTDWKTV